MVRNQWYTPNLLYNIHYRPQKQKDPPKMIVETRVYNRCVCTCDKHGCDPHYRMEKIVVWSSKAGEDPRKMKREASKQDTDDEHNDNIGKEDDNADGKKEVANVSVKSVFGGIDKKCSGDIVNADGGGKRNSVDCMENGDCDGKGISGENDICNGSIDHGSIGNGHVGRSCNGKGENSIGCGDDGCVDCVVGYGSIGNAPGDRSCIGNGEDRSECGDDGVVDCIVGDNSNGNDDGGQLYRQLQANDYIKSTRSLHITSFAPPQLDSIPTEKANMNVRDLTIEHVGTFPKCSQLKIKSRYCKVKFYITDQLEEAEEKRISQESEDTLKQYITVKEANQKDRKGVENGVAKRKSIGARIRGVLSNLFCCKSRRAALVD